VSGADVRVIETSLNKADVTGLADHSVVDLPISTVAGLIETSSGYIIGIFHQYALDRTSIPPTNSNPLVLQSSIPHVF